MPTINDSASGASYSHGAASVLTANPALLSAAGASESRGSAFIAGVLPPGGATDFGIWDPTGVDPAVSCMFAVTAGVPDGRAFIAASAPTSYTTALGTLWPGAVNAAVRATWPGATPTALTAAQFEALNNANLLSADAADYRTQLVYNRNTTLVMGVTVYDADIERSSERALTGTWAGKLTNDGALSPYSMLPSHLAMIPAAVGAQLTGSVYVALPRTGAQWSAVLWFYDSSFTVIGSGYVGAAVTHPGGYSWQQGAVTATAPSGTAWAAVVPQITPAAAGDGEVAYADCHRITCNNPAARLAPAAFQSARQQNITVHANRVNQVLNPSFAADTWGWYMLGGTTGSTFTQDPAVGHALPGASRVHAVYAPGAPAPGTGTAGAPLPGVAWLRPGGTYTMSVWVMPRQGIGMPPVNLFAGMGSNIQVLGNSTATTPIVEDGWYRLWVTFTLPQASNGFVSVWLYMNQADWVAFAGTVDWWVDDAMIEQSATLNDYFDGSEASPDYVWEGTANRSRTHYYRDFRSLQYRLNGLVASSVPLGVPYQLLYAQPDS
jgi:hypothetical protein